MVSAALVCALLLAAPPALMNQPTGASKKVLLEIAPLLDRKPTPDEEKRLLQLRAGTEPSVAALAAMILFKHEPARHRAALPATLGVVPPGTPLNPARISKDDMKGVVDAVEKQHPDVKDKRLLLLLCFVHFRARPARVDEGGQSLSAGHFFRTAFLASVLHVTALDPQAEANAIDKSMSRR